MYRSIVQAITTLIDGKANGMRKGWHLYLIFAFNDGSVKHIYFIAETKGTMDSLELRPIEQAKIACAKKLFNEISTSNVRYHDNE